MIDYVVLKAAMTAKGLSMSSGSQWTAEDDVQYQAYLRLHINGLDDYNGKMGMAYTELLPDNFPGNDAEVPVSVLVTGYTSPLVIGTNQQLVATATYSDGSTGDVTGLATWTSSDLTKATVTGGLATGVAAGSTNITATVNGIVSPVIATTVEVKTIVSVAVAGANAVAIGNTITLTASATYNDTSTDWGPTVTWASDATSVATVSSSGVVTGIGAGTANITATDGGVTSPNHVVTVS